MPRTVPFSLIVTVAFASPPPLTAGFEVILSVADTPVSATSASVTLGAPPVFNVNTTAALVPVLPARSLACAVRLLLPAASVTDVFHTPPVAVVAPIFVPLSNKVIVGLAARLASLTVPAIVCAAWLVSPPPLLMATAGAVVSRVNPSLLLVPVLPARSPAWAVITCPPSPARVIDVLQAPPLAAVVPIFDPLSNRVIVGLAARLASLTVPAIVWLAWLVNPPLLLIATAGAIVSRVRPS